MSSIPEAEETLEELPPLVGEIGRDVQSNDAPDTPQDDVAAVPEPMNEQDLSEKPFVIELIRRDMQPNGAFRPDSVVQISRSLRTSGLLLVLPPEELKSLVFLLTFLSPNGSCNPTLAQIAQAMSISTDRASEKMTRLMQFRWQGNPLVFTLALEGGIEAYALTPNAAAFIERPPTVGSASTALEPDVAGRQAVIAYSRARYGRPRAEVEALINRQLGHEEEVDPTDPAERPAWEARKVLRALGMTRDQSLLLFSKYSFERIDRQLAWLPYRHAKNPLGYLLAAIEGDYEMPIALRQSALSDGLPPEPAAVAP